MTEAAVGSIEDKYNQIVRELEEIEQILKELYCELEEEERELERLSHSGKSLKYEELEVDISSYEAEQRIKTKIAEDFAFQLNSKCLRATSE